MKIVNGQVLYKGTWYPINHVLWMAAQGYNPDGTAK